MNALTSTAIDILLFGLGFVIPVVIYQMNERRKHGHLTRFLAKKSSAKIVLSSVKLRTVANPFLRAQPKNVLFAPTAEGAALARLYLGLRIARKGLNVELVPAQGFDLTNNRDPFICIGGPSVNPISRALIKKYLPEFEIHYPQHIVKFDGQVWHTPLAGDEYSTEDFGFILSGELANGTQFAVVWGVFAFGTLAAARALLELSNRKQFRDGERSRFMQKKGFFVVVHAEVEGHQVIDPIQVVKPQPRTRY
jgi:hypothetical protein